MKSRPTKSQELTETSQSKPVAPPKTVEEYLQSVPEPARKTLDTVRARIRAVVPAEATECISYGMPAFRLKKALVGYAAFATHCSLFPMSGRVIEAMATDLEGYATSKGTIRFPIGKPLSAALIRKIVKARLEELDTK